MKNNEFKSFIGNLKNLYTIDFNENLTADQTDTLFQLLEKNKKITWLNFLLTNEVIALKNQHFFEKIANLLINNETILVLNLNYSFIHNEGLIAISNALEKNKTLKTLILNMNNFEKHGFNSLVSSLKVNNTLENLYLNNLEFEDENSKIIFTKYIIELLKTNKNLKMLSLIDNKIEFEKSFFEALKENRTLEKLNMSNNIINEEAQKTLVETLKINKSLHVLDISKNKLNLNTLENLIKNISNKEIKGIYDLNITKNALENNKINKETLVQIESCFKQNFFFHYFYLKVKDIFINVNMYKFNTKLEIGSEGFKEFLDNYLFDANVFNKIVIDYLKFDMNELKQLMSIHVDFKV